MIERTAIRYFEEVFDQIDGLAPEFKSGDKDRISDGFVYVYSAKPNAQSDYTLRDGSFVGRVTVQIKGRLVSKAGTPHRSFPLQKHQLQSIQKIGGLILLVAAVPRDGGSKPIPFYADLAPDNARHILEQMEPGQKQKAISLQQFPTDPDEVVSLMSHLQKRLGTNSSVKPNDYLMKNADKLTITTPGYVDYSRPQLIGGPGSSAIISVHMQGGEAQVIDTVMQLTPAEYGLHRVQDMKVACGGIEFADIRRRKLVNGGVELYLSPGVCLVLRKNGACRLRYRSQASLFDVSKDIAFLSNLEDGNPVQVNGVDALNLKNLKGIEPIVRVRNYLADLGKLCAYFGVDPKLFRVRDLPQSTVDELRVLTLHLFYGGAQFDDLLCNTATIEILGRQLRLAVAQPSSQVASLFDSAQVQFGSAVGTANENEAVQKAVTAFEFFNASELASTLNLNPELMVAGYRAIGGQRGVDLASDTVFKLVSAADQEEVRRKEFLEMALELSDWVIENDPENLSALLNRMQVRYRLGTLEGSDIETIESIWGAARRRKYEGDSLIVETVCSILLGQSDGTNYLLRQLDEAERQRFDEAPIMFLHKNRGQRYEVGVPSNAEDWAMIEEEITQESVEELIRYRFGKATTQEQN